MFGTLYNCLVSRLCIVIAQSQLYNNWASNIWRSKISEYISLLNRLFGMVVVLCDEYITMEYHKVRYIQIICKEIE